LTHYDHTQLILQVSLRTERSLLDTSAGFEEANPYQYTTAQACYRFIDSAVNFAPKEVNVLLRALQDEVPDERRNFFMEVRSNRRRKQTDPNGTPLKKVFSVQDEQNVLQYRIAVGRTVMVCYLAVSFKLVWIGWV